MKISDLGRVVFRDYYDGPLSGVVMGDAFTTVNVLRMGQMTDGRYVRLVALATWQEASPSLTDDAIFEKRFSVPFRDCKLCLFDEDTDEVIGEQEMYAANPLARLDVSQSANLRGAPLGLPSELMGPPASYERQVEWSYFSGGFWLQGNRASAYSHLALGTLDGLSCSVFGVVTKGDRPMDFMATGSSGGSGDLAARLCAWANTASGDQQYEIAIVSSGSALVSRMDLEPTLGAHLMNTVFNVR